MSTMRSGRPAGPLVLVGRQRRLLRRWLTAEDRGLILGLVTLVVLCAGLIYAFPPQVTAAVLVVPLFLGTLTLTPRRIPLLIALVLTALVVETGLELIVLDRPLITRRVVNALILLAMSAVTLNVGYRRERLGVAGIRGDAMLIDLQERISRQGRMPALPGEWAADVAIQSAEGTSFSGDFLVVHHDEGETKLSMVLADVSGKGVQAGTRALLLSGAFGGLLAALSPARFLPAANDFLLRQQWAEGFATAIHLDLDLQTGAFEVRSAGHPPAAHFSASSGRWQVLDKATGPVLGLVPRATYSMVAGELRHGDALFLYTDGLVERSRQDISLGIDRLLGQGERLVRGGFEGSARNLVNELGSNTDDCGLVVLYRR